MIEVAAIKQCGAEALFTGTYLGKNDTTGPVLSIPEDASLVIIVGGGMRVVMSRGDEESTSIGYANGDFYWGRVVPTWTSNSVRLATGAGHRLRNGTLTSMTGNVYFVLNVPNVTYHYYAF